MLHRQRAGFPRCIMSVVLLLHLYIVSAVCSGGVGVLHMIGAAGLSTRHISGVRTSGVWAIVRYLFGQKQWSKHLCPWQQAPLALIGWGPQ